jgi:RNA methyltransferase, TrmH family
MYSTLSKQKIKYIQSLKIKKYRQMYGNFIVEGDKMAIELLTDKNIIVEHIIAVETWLTDNANILKPYFNKILITTEADLKQISNLTTPNKVLVIAQQPMAQSAESFLKNAPPSVSEGFSLYLDGIQDPGNMGTILRIADWFSIPYVFCSPTSVDIWNPKVIQASMGAFLRVKAIEIDFKDIKNTYPKLPIFSTILRGDNIFKTDFPRCGMIVIGNEGNGVSDFILQQTDFKISIPGGGGAESLNAAIATGIVCAVVTQF